MALNKNYNWLKWIMKCFLQKLNGDKWSMFRNQISCLKTKARVHTTPPTFFFFFFWNYFRVYILWSEDNLWESVFSSPPPYGSRDHTQGVSFYNKCLYLLSQLNTPLPLFFKTGSLLKLKIYISPGLIVQWVSRVLGLQSQTWPCIPECWGFELRCSWSIFLENCVMSMFTLQTA